MNSTLVLDKTINNSQKLVEVTYKLKAIALEHKFSLIKIKWEEETRLHNSFNLSSRINSQDLTVDSNHQYQSNNNNLYKVLTLWLM